MYRRDIGLQEGDSMGRRANRTIQNNHIHKAEQAKNFDAMQKMRDRAAVERFHRKPYYMEGKGC